MKEWEEQRSVSVCFTGHRFLPSKETEQLRRRLIETVTDLYRRGFRFFYCGGALGFDTLAALTVLELASSLPEIRLILVVPCETQASRWHRKDQQIYRQICEKAHQKIVLSPVYYEGCMNVRNRYMVDRSSVCVCYLRNMTGGGTISTVSYAVRNDLEMINLALAPSGEREE